MGSSPTRPTCGLGTLSSWSVDRFVVKRRQSKDADEREGAAVARYLQAHPYASLVEVAEVRAAERDRGDEAEAAALDARAQEIEDALMESVREAVG